MPLKPEHILIPIVASALQHRAAPKPVLNYLEAAMLKDLASGASHSLKYSSHSTRKILRRLIDLKCASVPYQEIDGVIADLVVATDYGKEMIDNA